MSVLLVALVVLLFTVFMRVYVCVFCPSPEKQHQACGPLCAWVRSQMQYSEMIHKVQPLRAEVADLQDASVEQRERQQETQRIVDELQASIEQYKQVCGLVKQSANQRGFFPLEVIMCVCGCGCGCGCSGVRRAHP